MLKKGGEGKQEPCFSSILPSANKAFSPSASLMPKTDGYFDWNKGTKLSATAVQQAQVSHQLLKSGKALQHQTV